MSVRLNYELDDSPIKRRLRAMQQLGTNPQSILKGIAYAGEQSTRARFASETDPGGQKWQPSIRKREKGGKTLTDSGQLSGSITSSANRTTARWGTNKIYAAIHQFGGQIKAKGGGMLKFAIPGGGFASVKSVMMPARPFLGISAEDERAFADVVEIKLRAAAERGV